MEIDVYVKLDSNNVVKEIQSSIFLDNTEGWTKIDSGYGDKYSHAQSQYLDNGVFDNNGKYNYKFEDGELILLTDEEKATLFPNQPAPMSIEESLVKELAKMKLSQMTMTKQLKTSNDTITTLQEKIATLEGGK